MQELTLEDHVIAALRRITRAIDLHSRTLFKQYGLTTPQLAALHAVRRLQPVAIANLAKSIHLSQATLTGIVRRLEERDLVERSPCEADRRSVLLNLTRAGESLLESAPSLLQERFRRELAGLEEWERTQILATLQRIAAMMDAEGLEASPILAAGKPSADAADVSRFLEEAVDPDESGEGA